MYKYFYNPRFTISGLYYDTGLVLINSLQLLNIAGD